EGDCLFVRRPLNVHAFQRGGRELDRRVQRQRRELLALRFLNRLGLLLGKLPQAAQEILWVSAEREAAAFHGASVTIRLSRVPPCIRPRLPRSASPRRRRRPRRRRELRVRPGTRESRGAAARRPPPRPRSRTAPRA